MEKIDLSGIVGIIEIHFKEFLQPAFYKMQDILKKAKKGQQKNRFEEYEVQIMEIELFLYCYYSILAEAEIYEISRNKHFDSQKDRMIFEVNMKLSKDFQKLIRKAKKDVEKRVSKYKEKQNS